MPALHAEKNLSEISSDGPSVPTTRVIKPSTRSRSARLVVGAAAAALLVGSLAACTSSKKAVATGGASTTAAAAGVTTTVAPGVAGNSIEVKDFHFTPDALTVPVGTTVTWKFSDSTAHNVKPTDAALTITKSPDLANGKTYAFTFKSAGTFTYICGIHNSMKGSITVT